LSIIRDVSKRLVRMSMRLALNSQRQRVIWRLRVSPLRSLRAQRLGRLLRNSKRDQDRERERDREEEIMRDIETRTDRYTHTQRETERQRGREAERGRERQREVERQRQRALFSSLTFLFPQVCHPGARQNPGASR
jgi:hypothetical protein